jgi:hypothetical protein
MPLLLGHILTPHKEAEVSNQQVAPVDRLVEADDIPELALIL